MEVTPECSNPRVRLVDVGERTLVLEPVVTPAEKDRWVLLTSSLPRTACPSQ